MNHVAYILTSMTVAERVSDAGSLAKQLKKLNVFDRIELVPAIFWNDEPTVIRFLNQYPEHNFEHEYLEQTSKGEVCCTLSHIKAWRRLLDSGFDGAMIFEDDIYVSNEDLFRAVLSTFGDYPGIEWLRVHLNKAFRENIRAKTSSLDFVNDVSRWGFATYWVSRTGAQKLVQQFRDIKKPVDVVIPQLGRDGLLNVKTINKSVVEHHKFFEGNRAALFIRQLFERDDIMRQKQTSTIRSSPSLTHWDALHHFLTTPNNVQELRRDGVTVLEGVFDREAIDLARGQVMEHGYLYKNTRPTPSSRHLASFHRYPELESLHSLLAGDTKLLSFMKLVLGGKQARSIGLSDITINRSQPWHTDLLRGKYAHYLNDVDLWGGECAGVYKLLMYLQDGASLKVIRGSHRHPVSLENDEYAEPADNLDVMNVPAKAGDVVVMDIRTSHRGSTEEVFLAGAYDDDPKILVSTVLGLDGGQLTNAMEIGNSQRLLDWQDRYRDTKPVGGLCWGQDEHKSLHAPQRFSKSRTVKPFGHQFKAVASELAESRTQAKKLEAQLALVFKSRSWRISAPLRWMVRLVRTARG
jgi:GR25 family glycosyltransferase involved in LPS biosynthesis